MKALWEVRVTYVRELQAMEAAAGAAAQWAAREPRVVAGASAAAMSLLAAGARRLGA